MATVSKARSGDGSITTRVLKNGTKVYDVWVRYQDPDTGQSRRHVKRGFATKKQAVVHKNAAIAEAARGRLTKPARETVGRYLASWIESARLRTQTRAGYRRKLDLHVTPHIGHMQLGKLTPLHLSKLYQGLESEGSPGGKGPLSPRTVREIHYILRHALKDAVNANLLPSNPAERADPPSASEAKAPEANVWSADDVRRFLTAERACGSPLFPLWHYMVSTGVRRGEALGLCWRDIDFDARTACIRRSVGAIGGRIVREANTKSGKDRTIDLDAGTVEVLKSHKAAQAAERLAMGTRWADEDLVFARGSNRLADGVTAGGPLHPERVSRSFVAAQARHGMPRVRLHDLRHTWATLALKAGVPVKVVQERLGHATPMVTMSIYQHVMPGMQREAAEAVSALFA